MMLIKKERGKKLKIGIIGESGSGKTTIMKMLLRLIKENSGEILINGIDINHINEVSLRANIAYINQDPKLLNETLRYNLLMETDDNMVLKMDREEVDKYIDKYLRRINLESISSRLYEEIGKNGSRYSGGEKQRINIIRGLLKSSSVIILDEPTSALDVNAEQEVMRLIDELTEDKIIITIAHKLNTIKDVDYLYIIDKGKIILEGSLEEMRNNRENDVFNRMEKIYYGGCPDCRIRERNK